MGSNQAKELFEPMIENILQGSYNVYVENNKFNSLAKVSRARKDEKSKDNAKKKIDLFTEQYSETLAKIFDKYDKDKSGHLDEKETYSVVSDALSTMEDIVPEIISKMCVDAVEQKFATSETGAAMTKASAVVKSTADAAAISTTMTALAKNTDAVRQASKKMVENKINNILKNKNNITNQIIKLCDKNSDGKLSKKEFQDGFIRGVCHVFQVDQGQSPSSSCLQQ